VLAALASPPATKALDPDPFPCRSLRHVVYAALLHFGLETALENNLVLWKFEKGRRSSVEWVRNTPTPTRQWHDLKVRISGAKIEGYLDGKLYLHHTWSEPISGKIGLWSKADSYMHFDQFAAVPGE